MFMVLSSWQSHCESSPGSFDECRVELGLERFSGGSIRLKSRCSHLLADDLSLLEVLHP